MAATVKYNSLIYCSKIMTFGSQIEKQCIQRNKTDMRRLKMYF